MKLWTTIQTKSFNADNEVNLLKWTPVTQYKKSSMGSVKDFWILHTCSLVCDVVIPF